MASWTIERTDTFLKHLKKQKNNHELFQELESKIQRLLEDPSAVGGLLSGPLHGIRSTRLARKFRLLFQVDEEKRIVYLIALDHRKEVYE